jgi:N-acetylglucosamine-6-sulfatase
MRKVYEGIVVFLLFVLFGLGLPPGQPEASLAQTQAQPNIIFILTDDLDTGSIQDMPTVQKELIEKGTTFENGILTVSECCPSRATMLRGQYTHNHRIGMGAPHNARTFRRHGLENSTVATWLDEEGYKTALVGKYLNGYEYSYVPSGWDGWYANVSSDVWSECLNENGKERCYGGKHPDVVLAEKAERFVRGNEDMPAPLFLWLSFNAPHAPAPYTLQDRNKFSGTPLPEPPSFNESDVSDKPAWVRRRSLLTRKQIRNHTAFYRDRLRSLQTVDRAVGSLLEALADTGRLDNTYLVFWTDNGHHIGQHRLGALEGTPGKGTPYVEDIRVPLIVRGPGVLQAQRQQLVLNTDIAPTFAELAEAQTPDFVDGRSFAPLLRGEMSSWRNAGLVENRSSPKLRRPAYAGLITKETSYLEYNSGEKELYDLKVDPYQLQNIYQDADPALKENLARRLGALRTCEETACVAAENSP